MDDYIPMGYIELIMKKDSLDERDFTRLRIIIFFYIMNLMNTPISIHKC